MDKPTTPSTAENQILLSKKRHNIFLILLFLILVSFVTNILLAYQNHQLKKELLRNSSKSETVDEINPTSTPVCIDSDKQCSKQPDDTTCTTGIWCGENGKICGGNSCIGMGAGKCFSERCTSLCNNCPLYTPPPPGWCDNGKITSGESYYNKEENCYCLGPPKCITN